MRNDREGRNEEKHVGQQNLFEDVKQRLCLCSADLQLTPDAEVILKMPMRELHVSLPIRMDDGSIQAFLQRRSYRLLLRNGPECQP